MHLQPLHLRTELVALRPLLPSDYEAVYAAANDPLIWEQHPNPNRYKPDQFAVYFEGALQSGGAFLILDGTNDAAIGCTRFYDLNVVAREVKIGYTFFVRSRWGGLYNPAVKKMMIDYALQHVQRIVFHVGACNLRSQRAMEKLGALKTGEAPVAYHGEAVQANVVYEISAAQWLVNNKSV